MREQILELRAQGKTYDDIVAQLGCAKSTVSYYCGVDQKGKTVRRRKRWARANITKFKLEFGGKCCKCGYDRCFDALDFHHNDPKNKKDKVLYLLRNFSWDAAYKEAKKCILVCCRCHREIHSKQFNGM